eukprot:COSAG04_NODE_315_length_17025_cov_118.870318_4_plen_124_part_00
MLGLSGLRAWAIDHGAPTDDPDAVAAALAWLEDECGLLSLQQNLGMAAGEEVYTVSAAEPSPSPRQQEQHQRARKIVSSYSRRAQQLIQECVAAKREDRAITTSFAAISSSSPRWGPAFGFDK